MAKGSARLAAGVDEGSLLFPPFHLDLLGGQLWRGERLVPLKPKAFALLRALLEQPGQLLTQEELLTRLWGDVQLSEGVLKTHIAEIRHALGDSARAPRFIQTAHRRGYRFIAPVERRAPEAQHRRSAALSATPRPPLPRHFTGRTRELELLTGCWNDVQRGERQLVLITGEPGAGKTGLVNAFLRHLLQPEGEPVLVAWGQCIGQYGAGEPYLPIIEALRRCCAGPGGAQIADCLRRNAPSWLPVLPSLQALPMQDLTAPVPPGRMLREILEVLELLAGRQPVALLLEDLHWADHSTLELLGYLARRRDPVRLLVLGTYRPAEASGGGLANLATLLHSSRSGCELPVPPLSQQSVADYLALRFGQHQLPPAVPALIHGRTAGNALYMVGLVDGWLKRGLLRDEQGCCSLGAELSELASYIPDGFARMVEAELEGLDPFERSALEAASVAGNEFSTAAVAAALGADPMLIEELCVRWARHGQFFQSKGAATWNDGTVVEQCEFRHVLYQQIIYRQLGAARVARWHLRVAERLEQAHGQGAECISAELALHFQLGRDPVRAIRYLRSAGERALRRSGYQDAIGLLTRAIELLGNLPESPRRDGEELDLLLLLASPLRLTRGYAAPELERLYARAARLSESGASTAQTLQVLVGLGSFHIIRAEYLAAVPIGERLLLLAGQAHDDGALAEGHVVLGAARHLRGERSSAVRHLQHAVALHQAERHNQTWNMTSLDHGFAASGMLAHAYWMLGDEERAHAEVDAALQRALQLDSPVAQAFALFFATTIRLISGELEQTWQLLERLDSLSREHGLQMFVASATLHGAAAKILCGSVAEGVDGIERGLKMYSGTGTRVYASYWLAMRARGYALLGETTLALRQLNEILAVDRSRRELLWDAELWRLRGEILLECERKGDVCVPLAEAGELSLSGEGSLLRALAVARQQSALPLVLRSALSLGKHWCVQGEVELARRLMAEACAAGATVVGEDAKAAKAFLDEIGCA